MIRRIFFWMHLSMGIAAGVFIFVMSATGVLLAFERQILNFVDRDVRSVTVPQDAQPRSMGDLLQSVRRSQDAEPTAITIRNRPQSAVEFSIGRGRTAYVDSYSGAVLGESSTSARNFFSTVERFHRALGAPLGSRTFGRWLIGVSNLLFAALIPLGVVLWFPRRWSGNFLRASLFFRTGLRAKAREWNWHNVIGVWCAIPLFVIALTGVVMSFEWANTLLFQLSGSPVPVQGRRGGNEGRGNEGRGGPRNLPAAEPDYDNLLSHAKSLGADWRSITLNFPRGPKAPVSVQIDNAAGNQPQKRVTYLLDRNTAAVLKTTTFSDGTLGQRLRTFVRFGHTGEYFGFFGQVVAALASLGACLLAYTGISLSIRRLSASLKRRRTRAPVGELTVK